MSKVMLKTFPNMPDSSKICISCVKLYHEKNKLQSDPYIATSESNFDASISQSESDAESSPTKKVCFSRVDELKDLLHGLKEKFRSLPPNDLYQYLQYLILGLLIKLLQNLILPGEWLLRQKN